MIFIRSTNCSAPVSYTHLDVYKRQGYEISLRRQEAEMIEIISEQEAKEQAVQPDYHEGLGENMHLGERCV